MKFNRALLLPALLVAPLASCGGQERCRTVPGRSHSYPAPLAMAAHSSAGRLATAPGPDWMWLEGCWYWNGNDWAWLEQQWMPPGGQMNYVGPEDSRDDYCVYEPTQSYPLPVAMPWPPQISYAVGYSVQEVIVRRPYEGGYYAPQPAGDYVRDHRRPRRKNEVVPARRGSPVDDRPDIREPYLGPGPAARPPDVVAPPTPPSDPRPAAPSPGSLAPTPRAAPPDRPSAPPPGPAVPPPSRVRHDPPVSAPPPRPSPPPVTRPSAPSPAPARPTPPRAAPPPTPPRAAPPRPAAPDRGAARGQRR